MSSRTTRIGFLALAAAGALALAGCSGEPAPAGTTSTPAAEQEQTESTTVDVPDVTVLFVENAISNLRLLGLEAETVDEAGAPVVVEEPETYLVVSQDPASGTAERGSTVTLTVAPRS